jgi:hypothetical protein
VSTRRRTTVRTVLGAGALAALLAGCGGAPQLLSLTQACAADRDGSQVAVEGFLRADTAVSCNNYGGDFRCSLDAVESATGSDGPKAGLDILVGTGSDSMDELPSSYTDADLRLRADDGAAVHVGDRVRASGKASTGPGVCFVAVDKLEKL